MEEKDKYQKAEELLDELDERCRNGEKLPEEDVIAGFKAMITLYATKMPDDSPLQDNTESKATVEG